MLRTYQLLLACCRNHSSTQPFEPPLVRDVEWDQLPIRASRLGVGALVRSTLTRLVDRTRMPPEVLRRLELLYYEQAIRNARLGAKLEAVLAAFSRYSVPVIVLKGASLAELVYGNIALRPMKDLDVLVQPPDLDLADHLLRELGYVSDESHHPAEWYRRHHHHLAPYRARDDSILLELHHHIFPPAAGVPVSIEELWHRARPGCLSAGPALVLSPADLLLHLCVNLSAVEQFLGGLKTLCDIAEVIKQYEKAVDWDCLLQSARVYAVERHLYYGLWLAQCLVAADVPGPVLKTLEHSARGGWLEDRVVKSLIRRAVFRYNGEMSVVPAGLASRVCGELLAAKTARAKLSGLLRLANWGLRNTDCVNRSWQLLRKGKRPRPATALSAPG
jgi:hypothetical protein